MDIPVENRIKKRFSLGKQERLKSKKKIEELFYHGEQCKSYPVKAIYLAVAPEASTQIGVSVPKKLFKKAVHRNRLKRLIREAYRLQKKSLSSSYTIMFIYISKEKYSFKKINKAIHTLLTQIEKNTFQPPENIKHPDI